MVVAYCKKFFSDFTNATVESFVEAVRLLLSFIRAFVFLEKWAVSWSQLYVTREGDC